MTKTCPADMECGISEKLAEVAAHNYYGVQYEMEVTTHNVCDIPHCHLWQFMLYRMLYIINMLQMIAVNGMQMNEIL